MDRSDTSRDGKSDPAAAQSPVATNEVQEVHSSVRPAISDSVDRARIHRVHRAPPRPLVPRAYKKVVVSPRAAIADPGPAEAGRGDLCSDMPSERRDMLTVGAPPLPLAAAKFALSGQPGATAALPIAPSLPATGSVPFVAAAPTATPSSVPTFQPMPRLSEPARGLRDAPVPNQSQTSTVRRALRFAGAAIAAYFGVILALLIVFRFVNPPMSSLMLQQRLSGVSITNEWTDIENISPQIVRAVLLSEDGRFCQHRGVDLLEMQAAIERAGDGTPRGASTISMQVIKNLFLWPSKSYLRKAIEIPLTYVMELLWPKRRIMEVYLNIAEWGPGIFGVGAASQFHFAKAAGRLNEREAAQLAVALPNPYSRDAGDPGPQTRRLASDIQNRMRNAYPSQTACVLGGRAGR